ncbi:MAG: NAD(P)H-dependent oxidoreductase [Bacillota bacterium]|nr:NAD(P)H-dependent oxidoreductase [Bacillota bacterium]
MRILAVNGSPRGRRGNTERLLQPFLAGAREAGADVEAVYLVDHEIRHCRGCFTCWTKTPGVCVHRDDMPALLEKVRQADLVVYASPLYIFTVSGLMKDFMDRCIPLLLPYLEKHGHHYAHPVRDPGRWPKRVILLSNCGAPERHDFSGLVETFRQLAAGPTLELAGTILCAGGELLGQEALGESLRWYLEAVQHAGREVVEQGHITPETQAVLDQDLAEPEAYCDMANTYWRSCLGGSPEPGPESPSAPSGDLSPSLPLTDGIAGKKPETIRDALTGQAASFNPAAAGDLRADIQFHVTGKEAGDYVLRIGDRRCTFHTGTVPKPRLTIDTPSEVWLRIARGELSGQTAYLKGLYRVEGDLGLLIRMGRLFRQADGSDPDAAAPDSTQKAERPEFGRLPGMAWLALAFLPWIWHWSIGALTGADPWWRWVPSMALAGLLWGYRWRCAKPTWMETGTALYFGLAGLVSLVGGSFFEAYGDVTGSMVLAGVWLGSLASAMPLTGQYSKTQWPPEIWSTPAFLRTNAILTASWGGVYLLQALLALIGHHYPVQAQQWAVVRHLLLLPAAVFTAWFQKWYPLQPQSGTSTGRWR